MLSPFSKKNPDRGILFPVWCAADGIGMQVAALSPWIIGTYIAGYGFSASDAGILLSLEFGVMAIASYLIAPYMDRLPRRTIAMTGALIVTCGNLASIVLGDFWWLMAVRMLSGTGYGLSMAAGNATAAGAHAPSQLYGHKMAMYALYAFILFLVIPPIVETMDSSYLFGLMALFNLPFLYAMRYMPQHEEGYEEAHDEAVTSPQGATAPAVTRSLIILGFLILPSLLLFMTRDTIIYVFTEQIGGALDVNWDLLGVFFAISAVVAAFGPLFSVWLVRHFRITKPAIGLIILGGLLAHVMLQTQSISVFAFLVIIQGFINLGCYTVFMSLASDLDPHGRLTTACGGSMLAAYAISPALAASFFESGEIQTLQYLLIAMAVVSIGMLLIIRVMRKRVGEQTVAADYNPVVIE